MILRGDEQLLGDSDRAGLIFKPTQAFLLKTSNMIGKEETLSYTDRSLALIAGGRPKELFECERQFRLHLPRRSLFIVAAVKFCYALFYDQLCSSIQIRTIIMYCALSHSRCAARQLRNTRSKNVRFFISSSIIIISNVRNVRTEQSSEQQIEN